MSTSVSAREGTKLPTTATGYMKDQELRTKWCGGGGYREAGRKRQSLKEAPRNPLPSSQGGGWTLRRPVARACTDASSLEKDRKDNVGRIEKDGIGQHGWCSAVGWQTSTIDWTAIWGDGCESCQFLWAWADG
jgi:hypothetical protein